MQKILITKRKSFENIYFFFFLKVLILTYFAFNIHPLYMVQSRQEKIHVKDLKSCKNQM